MLETVGAVQFLRPMVQGKTRPALVAVGDTGTTQTEVIAKFSDGCEMKAGGLVAEAMGSMLADDLGLPTPRAYLVKLSKEFVDTITDPEVQALAKRSAPICFGSQRLPSGVRAWIAEELFPRASVLIAAHIFAFDALIDNVDRRVSNSNILTNGSQMWIYDHELAFQSHLFIGWKPPWEPGSREELRDPDRHVLFEGLRGKRIDFAAFQRSWENISDARLQEYKDSIPREWSSDLGVRDRAVAHIASVRANIVPSLVEVARVLR